MAYGLEEYARQICAAQAAYKYPAVTYDFTAHRECRHTTMADVEKRIQEQLRSRNQEEVNDGLSNVLYWGYASQPGRQRDRVGKFREKVTTEQIKEFINLLSGEHCFSFDYVINLRLPEFSGMSFVSKLLMFLCPDTHPVLDLKIARFAQSLDFPPLQYLKIDQNRIRLTKQNVQGYEQWAVWCTGVADQVNAEPGSPCHDLRAVDVERAIFWQVNSGYEKEASLLLQGPQSV